MEVKEKLNNITRVEVIDQKGRVYVNMNCTEVWQSIQDNGRTLKLFLHDLTHSTT